MFLFLKLTPDRFGTLHNDHCPTAQLQGAVYGIYEIYKKQEKLPRKIRMMRNLDLSRLYIEKI